MSVTLTEQAVVQRRKTVTRRLGWWTDKHGRRLLLPGDQLTLCRKVMGRRLGEPLVRLAEVQVVSVRREPLGVIDRAEVAREGFPDLSPTEFVAFFCEHMHCAPGTQVTRIAWRYLQQQEPVSNPPARRVSA